MVSGNISGGLRRQLTHLLLNHEKLYSLHFTNLRRSQAKILPSAFVQLLEELKDFVYLNWNDDDCLFQGKNVIAIDGSKYNLPYSEELRKEYDINSLSERSHGHSYYPQCLVSTFYDAYRKIPIIRDVRDVKGSERAVILENLEKLPLNAIIVADRGYYGYEVFHEIMSSKRDFLIRVPGTKGFRTVKEFAESTDAERIITVNKTRHTKFTSGKDSEQFKEISVRLVKYTPVDGSEEIIIATSLLDSEKYSVKSLQKLYWDRWQVELNYRDEKSYIKSADIRSHSVSGLLQELYAAAILRVVTNYEIYNHQKSNINKHKPQLFTAITTLASALPKLISMAKSKAKKFSQTIINVIFTVPYYVQKREQKYPRISQKPISKWSKKNTNNNGQRKHKKKRE